MRLLIVDDDADFREALVHWLSRRGFAVTALGEGAAALGSLDDPPLPDAVLLDALMPGMPGQEFLWRLRLKPGCAHLPVVVMSSHGATEGTLPPGTAFLEKPFEPEALVGLLRTDRGAAKGEASGARKDRSRT